MVLLGSSRIASEGLTLTNANHVLFVNRWWNPSANLPARDRVVRIGQRQSVEVRTFVCMHTIESRLESILARKETTFEELVGAITESRIGDLAELFEVPR